MCGIINVTWSHSSLLLLYVTICYYTGWSHLDVIRLAHPRADPTTKGLKPARRAAAAAEADAFAAAASSALVIQEGVVEAAADSPVDLPAEG